MGKNLRRRQSALPLEDHPGCMWGVLDILHHNQWCRVKKMLPHKRRHSGGHHHKGNSAAAPNDERNESEEEGIAVEEEKRKRPDPATRGSVGTRLKSFIVEELSWRRSRHCAGSIKPAQAKLIRSFSIHHLKHLEDEAIPNADGGDPQSQGHGDPDATNRLRGKLPATNQGCLHGHEGTPAGIPALETRETMLEQKLEDTGELAGNASVYRSKGFMDARNLISMNQRLFLKVLRSPSSSFPSHSHGQRSHRSKMELRKSGTFPAAAGSSGTSDGERRIKSAESNSGRLVPLLPNHGGDRDSKSLHARPEASSDGYPHYSTNNGSENRAVAKRFKNLRQKIKHVIRENKKERQRISRDAILHKIPYGQRFTRDGRRKEPAFEASSPGIKRAASLQDSLDKYCQLFESSFGRESSRYPASERLNTITGDGHFSSKSGSKSFRRILSLPDLRSRFDQRREVFHDSVSPGTPIGPASDDEGGQGTEEEEEEEVQIASEEYGGRVIRTGPASVGSNESAGKAAADEIVDEPERWDVGSAGLSTVTDSPEGETPAALWEELVDFDVDVRDVAAFSYVREVLELSGMGGDGDALGAWQSGDQEMDPAVSDRMERWWVDDGAEPWEKGDGGHGHLLMFDLVNEMLVEAYDRLFCYYPVPSCSSESHVRRPISGGHRLLSEVWRSISRCLSFRPQAERSLGYVLSQDLSGDDGWMNLRFEAECMGLEIEEWLFDDMLEEIISS